MRPTVRFIRRGKLVELVDIAPTTMLLDYLRETEGATGTKEGCGEGDCGACTVALGRMRDGKLVYEPVNACIQLLGQVDGAEVLTIEDLAEADGTLHPIQLAMVQQHPSNGASARRVRDGAICPPFFHQRQVQPPAKQQSGARKFLPLPGVTGATAAVCQGPLCQNPPPKRVPLRPPKTRSRGA